MRPFFNELRARLTTLPLFRVRAGMKNSRLGSSWNKAREIDGSARCASPLRMLNSVWCYYCRVKGSNRTSTILWWPNLWPTHKEWPLLAGKAYEIFGAAKEFWYGLSSLARQRTHVFSCPQKELLDLLRNFDFAPSFFFGLRRAKAIAVYRIAIYCLAPHVA